MWRYLRVVVLLVCGVGLALSSAGGQVTQGYYGQPGYYAEPIYTGGATCFLYSGYAYVPLTSAAGFVGATLTWQGGNTFTIWYEGRDLTMTLGSVAGTFAGSPVRFPVPPAMVEGFAMVPVFVFHDYLATEVNWEPDLRRVVLWGPAGYGYFDVVSGPPPSALGVLRGYGAVAAPSAFYYNSVPYVPLQDWCGFLGVPVYYEPAYSDFVLVVAGRELLLFVGRSYAFYGSRYIRLPGAPIIVRHTVCVPVALFQESPIGAHVVRRGDLLRVKGRTAWRQVRLAPSPPAAISVTLPQQPQERLGIPVRPREMPGVVTPTPRQFGGRPPYERFTPFRPRGGRGQMPGGQMQPPAGRPGPQGGRMRQVPLIRPQPQIGPRAGGPGGGPPAGFGHGMRGRGGPMAPGPEDLRGPRMQGRQQGPPQGPQRPSFAPRRPFGGGAGTMRERRQEPSGGRAAGPRSQGGGERGGGGRGRGRDASQGRKSSQESKGK